MTMDQVITLASLIEREAQVDSDFAKVSAVFHNRLKSDMPLQSCASLSYVLNVKKYTFTESELATESPYNTYLNRGLPVGPISNPARPPSRPRCIPTRSSFPNSISISATAILKRARSWSLQRPMRSIRPT